MGMFKLPEAGSTVPKIIAFQIKVSLLTLLNQKRMFWKSGAGLGQLSHWEYQAFSTIYLHIYVLWYNFSQLHTF